MCDLCPACACAVQATGLAGPPEGCYWIRSEPGNKYSSYSYIEGSENPGDSYQLSPADAGCYLSFQQTVRAPPPEPCDEEPSNATDIVEPVDGDVLASERVGIVTVMGEAYRANTSLGPVLPGPPRLLDLTIEGEARAGSRVHAVARYIGGTEGPSEYWWFRINGGKRQQLSQPSPIRTNGEVPPHEVHLSSVGGDVSEGGACDRDNSAAGMAGGVLSEGDPRVLVLGEDDVGCTLKVKCRPIRADGYKGEVFTSQPSAVITSAVSNEDEMSS